MGQRDSRVSQHPACLVIPGVIFPRALILKDVREQIL